MTSGFAVFCASVFDSGYMYCQSTKASIFHIFLRGFTRILRSFLVLLFLSFLAVACAKLVLLVILHLALFLFFPVVRPRCSASLPVWMFSTGLQSFPSGVFIQWSMSLFAGCADSSLLSV